MIRKSLGESDRHRRYVWVKQSGQLPSFCGRLPPGAVRRSGSIRQPGYLPDQQGAARTAPVLAAQREGSCGMSTAPRNQSSGPEAGGVSAPAVNIGSLLIRLHQVSYGETSGWQALCPAHDDHDPSLSIDMGDDGRILLHCFAAAVRGDRRGPGDRGQRPVPRPTCRPNHGGVA